jgi:uncharacterized protein
MELLGFSLVILIASILQGITGFGSALIAAPLLLLFLDKTTSIISLTFVSIALNGFLFWKIKTAINRKIFITLFMASLTGLPLGIYILKFTDIQALRILAGSLSVLFAVLLYLRIIKLGGSKIITVVSGMLAGILHTSISMSGPPVVLLVAGQNKAKEEARKTFAAFFLAMSIVSVLLFSATQNLTNKSLTFGLYGIPAAFVGGFIGNRIAKHVSHRQFMVLTFALVCITGILAVYSGLYK